MVSKDFYAFNHFVYDDPRIIAWREMPESYKPMGTIVTKDITKFDYNGLEKLAETMKLMIPISDNMRFKIKLSEEEYELFIESLSNADVRTIEVLKNNIKFVYRTKAQIDFTISRT